MANHPADAGILELVEDLCGKRDAESFRKLLGGAGESMSGEGVFQFRCSLELPGPFTGVVCRFALETSGETAWTVEVFPEHKDLFRTYRFRRDGRVEEDVPSEPSLLETIGRKRGPRFARWEDAIADIRYAVGRAGRDLRMVADRCLGTPFGK